MEADDREHLGGRRDGPLDETSVGLPECVERLRIIGEQPWHQP